LEVVTQESANTWLDTKNALFNKLELESDPVDKSNYTEMLKRTVKSVID